MGDANIVTESAMNELVAKVRMTETGIHRCRQKMVDQVGHAPLPSPRDFATLATMQ